MHPKRLHIGDIFVEDGVRGKFKVTKEIPNGVIGEDIDTGEEITFYGSNSAYAPTVHRIEESK